MKIARIINNNVVSTTDSEGAEIVAMGRGIGFRAKEGDSIDPNKVEKIFRLESQNSMDQFKELLAKLPMEHIEVSVEIISYAKKVMNRSLNPNVYVTLTDHIDFAIKRCKRQMMFPNPLLREIRNFYREEYLIGEYAIALIERKLGIKFPPDEAASIALHIVNAEFGSPMGETIRLTNLMQQILQLVQETFALEYDKDSLNYERFTTHLRFLAQQVISGELQKEDEEELQQVLLRLCPEEFSCSQKIAQMIQLQHGHRISGAEICDLALHIRRIRNHG